MTFAQTLRFQFGLTVAESNFAVAFMEAASVQAAAKKTGYSIETARIYQKRVRAKTGTANQAALMKLLMETSVDEKSR